MLIRFKASLIFLNSDWKLLPARDSKKAAVKILYDLGDL